MKTLRFTLALLLSASGLVAQTPDQPAEATREKSAAPGDVAIQLAAARKQLAILRARHGENHPTVQKQLLTVVELQKKHAKAQTSQPVEDKASQLEAAKRELGALRVRYTDQHPAVKAQLQKIAALESVQ